MCLGVNSKNLNNFVEIIESQSNLAILWQQVSLIIIIPFANNFCTLYVYEIFIKTALEYEL